MKSAANVLLMGAIVTFFSCIKPEYLGELEPNKYNVDSLPSPMKFDSIHMMAMDPTHCELVAYVSYDVEKFNSEWDEVESVTMNFNYLGPAQKPSDSVAVIMDATGHGSASPKYAYTVSQYRIAIKTRLVNGRNTTTVDTVISTPEF